MSAAMVSAVSTTRTARWQDRVDALPPVVWLALQAAALWTHWRWAAARVSDGSDDPLGLAALAVLLWAVARHASELRGTPRSGALAAALLLSVAATVAAILAPPLLAALVAALALVCGLHAFMPSNRATLPLTMLAVLALPVISSWQFYAGYPLRVLTAQLSTWALQLAGMQAERSGSSMQVDGQLVIVDAPCSGVQMVWMAYFCASAIAAFLGLGDRRFLARLPAVGVLVLLGNVVRNTLLVALEVRGAAPSEALHQGIGMAVLALVCFGVVGVMSRARDDAR
jgi:exosortase/archaeosortase family protein